MSEERTKWGLSIGIHRGTVISRDTDYQQYNSRQEAIDSYNQQVVLYASSGYYVWYANLFSPQGEKEVLAQETPYY